MPRNAVDPCHSSTIAPKLQPIKSLVDATIYDFQRIPKPQAAGSNPAGGTYSIYKHMPGRYGLVSGLCGVLGGQVVGRVGDGGYPEPPQAGAPPRRSPGGVQ